MNLGGALTGLVGAGGPGGAFSSQAQQQIQQKQQLAMLFHALQQAKQQQTQQQGQPPGALPGSPQGQGGFAGGLPNLDQMISQISTMPGNDAMKMQVLEQYGAFASPFEKMQQQLIMQQQKLDSASQRLSDQMENMRVLQTMRNQQSGANTDKRVAATVRGQDINATNTDKRVGAEERGQDMRSDTAAAALVEKNRHATTMENIDNDKAKNQAWRDKLKQEEVDRHNLAMENIGGEKADTAQYVANTGRERAAEQGRHNTITEGQGQQRADAATQNANTNKFSAMVKDKQGQQKIVLEIQKLKAKVPPQNNKPFKVAEDTYKQAAALYNKVAGPQYNGQPSDSHTVEVAKNAMDKAQAKMNDLATLPEHLNAEDITPENLEHTAKVNGITVDEVKKRLGVQ